MKKYVFFTPFLVGMGGGQMYIRNKILYLKENGWIVDVITSRNGERLIDELKEFNKVYPELIFPTFYYFKGKRNRIIRKLADDLYDEKCDEIVIESTFIASSTWAEAVASRIGAKHFVFLVGESNEVWNKSFERFFVFKHKRKELASITATSLQQMFEHFYPIPPEQSYRLPAWCNNVEADIDSPIADNIDSTKYDYIIGCLGRLEKPFIVPAITDFCQYAKENGNRKFLLIIIGGAPDSNLVISQLRDLITGITQNVDVVFTGYIYPVPIKLLMKCDAFLSSAGSAGVCRRSGAPTITYDGNDFRPIGIYGRTTKNSLFRGENEKPQNLSTLLDDILVHKKYIKTAPSFYNTNLEFERHLEFLESSSSEKEYYNIEKLVAESRVEKKLKIRLFILGAERYYQMAIGKDNRNRRKIVSEKVE